MAFIEALEKVNKKLKEVLEDYNIRYPAVSVENIAIEEGFQIVHFNTAYVKDEKLENVSGFTFEKKIYINSVDSKERQRFTIAHELGHYFLGHKPDETGVLYRNATYGQHKNEEEVEADLFAAGLLMPKEMIEELAKDRKPLSGFDENDIEDFAKKFEVSVPAMKFRIMNIIRDR